jgi:hypothetical protein
MHQGLWRAPGVFLAVVAAAALIAPPASAQSEADLRRTNQALQTQVRDLTRELEAARARVRDLEAENARLARDLETARRGGTPLPPPPPERTSVDESVPSASPRALYKALVADYAEATRDLDAGTPGSREAAVYLATVRTWAARRARELRAQITWQVRVLEIAPAQQDRSSLRLLAVDPQTHVALGDPFNVQVAETHVRRLRELSQRGGGDLVEIHGLLVPEVRVNEARPQADPFDAVPLIGPYAEFGFRVDVRTITAPAREKEKEKEKEEPAKPAAPAKNE